MIAAAYAIIMLDTLAAYKFSSRDEVKNACVDAMNSNRPFAALKWNELGNCYAIQEHEEL